MIYKYLLFILFYFILMTDIDKIDPDYYEVATSCVVSGYDPRKHNHAANPPIYLTSTFEFDTA